MRSETERIDPHDYATIQRASKGSYRFRIVYNSPETGKTRYKYTRTKVDANEWIEGPFLQELKRHNGSASLHTFKDVFQFFIEENRIGRNGRPPVGEGYLSDLERLLRLHLDDPFMDRMISETAPSQCLKFMRDMVDKNEEQKIEAARYVKYATDHAASQAAISFNPMASIKVPAQKTRSSTSKVDPDTIPSRTEIRDIIQKSSKRVESGVGRYKRLYTRLHAMVCLAIYTGLRQQEIRALRMEDIEGGWVSVRQVVAAGSDTKIKPPKTRAGIRDVPIPDTLAREISPWLEMRAIDSDLVFPSDGVNPITRKRMNTSLKNFLTDAGYPNYSWHGFRHAYASNALDQKIDLNKLTTYLGHSRVQTTIDIYGHLFRDMNPFIIDY